MLNLYWQSGIETRTLTERPFGSEADLETYIYQHQDLLGGDIYVIHRQVATGSHEGIPDMIGVDQDGRVCIIELKNVTADEAILPQALGYALWAETNPDSIKAIWLESTHRPEEVEIDWDNLDIRIILIAPRFKATVLRMAGKINYDVDLMQVTRFSREEDEFLLLQVLDEPEALRPTITRTRGDWDWAYYEAEHGKDAAAEVRHVVEALDAFCRRQGWDVAYNINKGYVGFKLGNRVVFDVAWTGVRTWMLEIKLPREIAEAFQRRVWDYQSYTEAWENGRYRPLDPANDDITELEPLLIQAYERISGVRK